MLRGVGDADARLGGERIHVARRLHEQFEEVQPTVAGQRRTDPGELAVERTAIGLERSLHGFDPPPLENSRVNSITQAIK